VRKQDILCPKKCSHNYLLIVKGKKNNRVSWKGIKVQYDKLPKSNQRPRRAEKERTGRVGEPMNQAEGR
jgi:hypothetical protein